MDFVPGAENGCARDSATQGLEHRQDGALLPNVPPETKAADQGGAAVTWLVFWSNDRQAHRIARECDPPPSPSDYVQVGEFTDYAYARKFVNQRMSVRRLQTTTEDDGFGADTARG